MNDREHTRKLFWRWHKNPLRRRDDLIEAWIVLAVWTATVIGGLSGGLATVHAADAAFVQHRAELRPVTAVLVHDVPVSPSKRGTEADRLPAKVRWEAPDGSPRTGRTLVDTGRAAGTGVTVWQDGDGALKTAPASPTEAAGSAAFLGILTGLAVVAVVQAVGAAVRSRLDRRRLDEWGREWETVGPRWGHRAA
ncbi:hypothetical protein [Streptomyces sp. NPDC094437]|uniref:Rv1733c family protein n=1 Tax=Streptomyces sp. NPDC094437 TaxID=3366060 RepID=UPI0038309304